METWTIARIEDGLLKSIGKITLGIATPATINCVRIACNEVARRQAYNVGRDLCDQYDLRNAAMIASKAAAMI